jgi:hypothetical protein
MNQRTCNNCGESFTEDDLSDDNLCPHCGKNVDNYRIEPGTGYFRSKFSDLSFRHLVKEYGKIARTIAYLLSILVFVIGLLDTIFLPSGEIFAYIILALTTILNHVICWYEKESITMKKRKL